MEVDEQCCELCGSDSNTETITIRIESSVDDVMFDKAVVCLNCYTRYENNMVMFIDIYKNRLELEEEFDDQMDI